MLSRHSAHGLGDTDAGMVSVVAWFVGAVLLALPFLRRRVAPRSVGYLLCVSALWMPLGNFVIAPSGPAANVLLNLLSNLGPVWLLAALAALGWRLWAGSNEPGRAELGWSHDHRSPGSVRRHA